MLVSLKIVSKDFVAATCEADARCSVNTAVSPRSTTLHPVCFVMFGMLGVIEMAEVHEGCENKQIFHPSSLDELHLTWI